MASRPAEPSSFSWRAPALWIGPACLLGGFLLGRGLLPGQGRVWSEADAAAARALAPRAWAPSFAAAVARARGGIVAVRALISAEEAMAEEADAHVLTASAPAASLGVRQGSGFVVHRSGLVVTARHVVAQAQRVVVAIPGSEPLDASVVGEDEVTDLAVLRIADPPAALAVLELGRSEDLRAGDWIVAVGNPFGFAQTVTAGVVSFVGRHLPHYDLRVTNDFLQFSAPVNPGSSGSPVLDAEGRVVGVTTQHANEAEGISFAIPSRTLKWVLDAMDHSADGRVHRGYLGIEFEGRGADEHGRPLPGARVLRVAEGEPAHRAGLRRGDLVLDVDGHAVTDAGDLHDCITRTAPGTTVHVTVQRDGRLLAPVAVELRDVVQDAGPRH